MIQPRMIGQYQLGERLATGGAGEIYAGIDTKLGREVAIKFLRPELASDPSYVDRFLVEAKSLARLNHPNIATLYALPQEDDQICMIMEFVRGRTVEHYIQDRRGPLGVRESLAIIAQVADGLSYAHEQGVIHRDIKPSNLMVTESGRVKIMDFGIARVLGSARLTRVGSAIGTPLYMSPEQHRGQEGDERSDIYSLAVVLYELLTGAPPFLGTTDFELAKAHQEAQPQPLIPRVSGVEQGLESAIMIALSKRPEQRFASMRAFSDATGATALRGDATAIIETSTGAAEGPRAAPDMQKRAPLYTVALALARSRAAAIARRFKALHPAVKGVSLGALAVAVAGILLLVGHPASRPIPAIPAPVPLPIEKTQGQESRTEVLLIEPKGPPSNSAPTEPASLNPSRSGISQGQQVETAEMKPAPQAEGSARSGGVDVAFANFKAAYDQADYKDALSIAEKLYAAGDPAGAYGEGILYVHGYGGLHEEPARARNLFYEAATAKNPFPLAMVKLGVMYHEGKGGDQNKRLARTWFEKAADLGEGEAMFNLGQMCWLNEAGLKHKDAMDFYRRARNAGYLPARQRLEELGVRD